MSFRYEWKGGVEYACSHRKSDSGSSGISAGWRISDGIDQRT